MFVNNRDEDFEMILRIKCAWHGPALFILFVTINLSFSLNFTRFQRFPVAPIRWTNHYKTMANIPLVSCSVLCHYDGDCESINYNTATKTCEMNVMINSNGSVDFAGEQGWYMYISAKSRCLKGWLTLLDSCYLFENKRKANWYAAWDECAKLNAHLATIESELENYFITAELQRLNRGSTLYDHFFIAGNDLGVENEWVWAGAEDNATDFIDGQTIVFSDWYDGEPNNSNGDEDCLTIRAELDYKWNDFPCSDLSHFICEK